MNIMDLEIFPEQNPAEANCVVRVSTTSWADRRGLHMKKSLTFLRRQCKGINLIEEDIRATSPTETMFRISNWNEVTDGLYTVEICNESRDWESGYVEDWDYRLVPKDKI